MLVSAFKTLGLQEEDARLYRSLLEEGAATAGELAKRTGLVRTTLYNTLQRLTAAGVIKRSLRHGVRTFTAAPPRQIGELLASGLKSFCRRWNLWRRTTAPACRSLSCLRAATACATCFRKS
jgi:sugar-specific transcriptional regulator TrmB